MNAVWVKVLRNKYGVISRWSASIHPSNSSFLWRAVSNIWEDVVNGVYWALGNGRTVVEGTDWDECLSWSRPTAPTTLIMRSGIKEQFNRKSS
ncbi:hypothetical protein J1N35_024110 [Gossypium stocksii]|uniref:Reverse transcriptase zinc-binding domain-containing protein n=1 Tax=Gossypium stocksii TaxID=47602 RepID=A0A9D3VLI0_9ROSI|nr:hypothetical protein J1N35_024110 [Gossypium stocksii]